MGRCSPPVGRSAAPTTGEVLQTIPDGLLAVMWVDSGLVLYEQDDAADSDSSWLWDPSDPAIPPSKVVVPA